MKKKSGKSVAMPSREEILEALETPSPGRLKVLTAAHEAGAFIDRQLADAALRAIDDSQAKVADYIATTILPALGPQNHPWLMRTADPKNKQGYFRRIVLMVEIDPLATQPLVQKLAKESKSPVLKTLAIRCLAAAPENLELLKELHGSKDYWVNALGAIARMGTAESLAFVLEQLQSDNIYPLIRIATDVRPPGLVEAAIELTREALFTLAAQAEVSVQQSSRFRNLVDIATAIKQPGSSLSDESELLLMECLDHVPALLKIDMGMEHYDMVCVVMRRLAYNGTRAGCMYMLEHRDRLPADYHTLISAAADRHLSDEERVRYSI